MFIRARDFLVLFGPLSFVTAIGLLTAVAAVRQADRHAMELEAQATAAIVRGHVTRGLRTFVRDARPILDALDGPNAPTLLQDLEAHGWMHGLDVMARIAETLPVVPQPDDDRLRIWLPLADGRRLIADIDLSPLVAEAAEVTQDTVTAGLVSHETPPGVETVVRDGQIVSAFDVGQVVAPAQVLRPGLTWQVEVPLAAPPPLSAFLSRHPILTASLLAVLILSAVWSHRAARAIGHRRDLMRRLEESRVSFKDFAEIGSDWFWEMDTQFRMTGTFGRFEEHMGLREEDLIGRHYRDLIAAHATPRSLQDPAWGQSLLEALNARRPVHRLALEWRRPDGDVRAFLVNARPVFDGDGTFQGYRGTVIDQTDLVRTQEDLRRARDAAEQAHAFKNRFMAGLGHDLQQPLMSIALFAARLAYAPPAEETVTLAAKISQTAESCGGMLTHLRDLSRLEDASLQPEVRPLPLAPLINRLSDEFALLCERRNLCLRVLCAPDQVVMSDGVALERILRNLLSNAIRYTDDGVVMVTVRQRGGGRLIQVWDTGCGIPAEDLERIFREHWRGAHARTQPGLGLGLAVVQRAAAALGHDLSVRSRLGRGSVFGLLVAAPAPERDCTRRSASVRARPVPAR